MEDDIRFSNHPHPQLQPFQSQNSVSASANAGGSRFSRLRFTTSSSNSKNKERDSSRNNHSSTNLAVYPDSSSSSSLSETTATTATTMNQSYFPSSSSSSSSHSYHPPHPPPPSQSQPWSSSSPSSSISPSLYPAAATSSSSHSFNHSNSNYSPLSTYQRPLPDIPPDEDFEHPSSHPASLTPHSNHPSQVSPSPRLKWPAFHFGGASTSQDPSPSPNPNPTSAFDPEDSPPMNSSSSIPARYAKAAWGGVSGGNGGGKSQRSSPTEEFNHSSTSVGPSKSPSSQFASNMRAAGHSAGAGLKKLGKVSAGKLRQRAMSNSGVVGLGLSGSSSSSSGKEKESTVNAPPVPSIPSHYGNDSPTSFTSIPKSQSSSHTRNSSLGTLAAVESVPDPRIGMPYQVQHNVHVDVGPWGFTGLPSSWAKALTAESQSQGREDLEYTNRNKHQGIEDSREGEEYVQGENEREEEWNREMGRSTWDDDSSGSGATSIGRGSTVGRSTIFKSTSKQRASRSRDESLDREKSFKSTQGKSFRSDSSGKDQEYRASIASTSYSSVLNQGWPSPTWTNAHFPPSPSSTIPPLPSGGPSRASSRPPSAGSAYAIPPLPNQASFKSLDFLSQDSPFKKVEASPLLPDLRSDDDWASSLLLSLPQEGSSSNTSDQKETLDENPKIKSSSSVSPSAMAAAKLIAERKRDELERKKDRRRSRSVDFGGIRQFGSTLGSGSGSVDKAEIKSKNPTSSSRKSSARRDSNGSLESSASGGDGAEELVHVISSASVDRVKVHQGGKARRFQTSPAGGSAAGSSDGHSHGLGIMSMDRVGSPLSSSNQRHSEQSRNSSLLQSPISPASSPFSAGSDSNHHSARNSSSNQVAPPPPPPSSSSLKNLYNAAAASRSTPSLALINSTASHFAHPTPASPSATFKQSPIARIETNTHAVGPPSDQISPSEKTSLPGIPGLGLRDKRKAPPKIYPPSSSSNASLQSARRGSSHSASSDTNPPLSPYSMEFKRAQARESGPRSHSQQAASRRGSEQSYSDRLPSPSDQLAYAASMGATDNRGSISSSRNSHSSEYESLGGTRSPGEGLHPRPVRRNSKSSQSSEYTVATNPGSASVSGSSRRDLNSRATTSPEARTSIGSNTSYSNSTRVNSPATANFSINTNPNSQAQKRAVPIISPGPNGFYQAPPVIRSSSRPGTSQNQDINRTSPTSDRSDSLPFSNAPNRQDSNDLALPSPSYSRFSDSTRISSRTASSGGRGAASVEQNDEGWARDEFGARSSSSGPIGFGRHLSASPMSAGTSLRSLSPRAPDEDRSSSPGSNRNGGASGGNSPSGRSAPLVEEDDEDYVDEEDEEDLPPALPPKDLPSSRRPSPGFPPLPSPTEVRPKSALSQRRARQKERSDFLNNVPKTAPLFGNRSGFPNRSSPSPSQSPQTNSNIPLHGKRSSEERPERPPSSREAQYPVSRPSSRSSRHSVRSVSRKRHTKTPRRSTDAKRFPVSMAFSNPDDLDLPMEEDYEDWEYDDSDEEDGTESERRATSRSRSRQHQSLDLDDVLPPQMVHHPEVVPPLPPMPHSLMMKKSQDQLRQALTDSPNPSASESPTQISRPQLQVNGSGEESDAYHDDMSRDRGNVSPAQVLPEEISHLDFILRPEPGSSALTELTILGEGESGNVYSACCSPSAASSAIRTEMINSKIPGGQEARVAVKVIRIPSEDDPEATARVAGLRKELKFWEQCSLNPNVLTFFSAFYDPGNASSSAPSIPKGIWVCQELAERSLADLIPLRNAGVELLESHMALVMSDMLQALEFLHSKNIVHRDCRSDIVMLTASGLAKLSDFTHAAQLAPPGQDGKRHSQGVVITEKRTSVVGTAYWMSPEVVKAEAYDVKADIWSLGVILFEMIEGDPPRVDFPPLRAITLTAKLGLPPLSNPNKWSRELKEFIAWATEMDPENRPSAEMLSQTEFPFNACERESMISLLQDARRAEEEEEAQDSEILDEAQETNGQVSPADGGLRNSWNSCHSGSTIHA